MFQRRQKNACDLGRAWRGEVLFRFVELFVFSDCPGLVSTFAGLMRGEVESVDLCAGLDTCGYARVCRSGGCVRRYSRRVLWQGGLGNFLGMFAEGSSRGAFGNTLRSRLAVLANKKHTIFNRFRGKEGLNDFFASGFYIFVDDFAFSSSAGLVVGGERVGDASPTGKSDERKINQNAAWDRVWDLGGVVNSWSSEKNDLIQYTTVDRGLPRHLGCGVAGLPRKVDHWGPRHGCVKGAGHSSCTHVQRALFPPSILHS